MELTSSAAAIAQYTPAVQFITNSLYSRFQNKCLVENHDLGFSLQGGEVV